MLRLCNSRFHRGQRRRKKNELKDPSHNRAGAIDVPVSVTFSSYLRSSADMVRIIAGSE